MPELPDVAVFTAYLNRTALHKKVETARVYDEAVIKSVSARTVQRRLKGRTLEASRRRGKHLFVELDADGGWLGLHFGMTGYLRYHKNPDDTPDHTRLRLDLTNGYRLSYVCQRKFGEVRIINDLHGFIAERDLGPDALEVSRGQFIEALGGRRGRIKSALMNQSIFAGLGNVYTDEILHAARLHPNHPVNELDEESLGNLYERMIYVLEASIDAKADPSEMPEDFLLPHRSEGEECPACPGTVRKIEVSGRPTYYCPSCQEEP